MGAWDTGCFGNDTALDWAAEFSEASRKEQLLRKSLGRAEDGEEGSLAAAEVVAALNGYPPPDLPEEIKRWAARAKAKTFPELIKSAVAAVDRVAAGTELAGLWKESEEYEKWRSVLANLRDRLLRPRVSPEKPVPVKKKAKPAYLGVIRVEGMVQYGSGIDFRASGLPVRNESAESTRIDRIDVQFGLDFTGEELAQIAEWAGTEVAVHMSDTYRYPGFKLNYEWLRLFLRARTVSIHLQSAKSLDFLAPFSALRRLEIVRLHSSCDLCAAPVLPGVEDLVVGGAIPLPNLNFFTSFPSVRRLEIFGFHKVPDTAGLFSLSKLDTLNFSRFVSAESAELLPKLPSLRRIGCAPTSAAELALIAKAPHLRELSFWLYDGFEPEDFDCFKGHPSLRAVSISGFGWKANLDAVLDRTGLTEADPRAWN